MGHHYLFILILVFFCGCEVDTDGSSEQPLSQRPNILFIMADDHAYQAISSYDSALIKTPNIDRIANEGIKFTNACVTNSICAPSRATILTGKHSHINGKIDNISPFDTSQVTFPQLLQESGYTTAMFGKLHFGNSPKGIDEYAILPGQGSYLNPDFITNNGDTTIEGYVTDIVTDMTIDWLDKKRDTTKPFLLMYLHKAPHRPWWPSPDKFAEFSKRVFPEPITLFDDYKNRGTAAKTAEMSILKHLTYSYDVKVWPKTIAEMEDLNPNVPPIIWGGKNAFDINLDRANPDQRKIYESVIDSISSWFKQNWEKLSTKEKMKWKYQRYMQDYLACISSVDDNVGKVLNYLDENDLTENTIVVYTSDQGFYLGEHGWFDKRFIYDESFKTPLLVRWPNEIKSGITNEEMVQNLDFAQTFLEAAQLKAPEDMQGESLMPLLKGNSEKWHRNAVYYHYYEYPGAHMVKKHYGIVTKEFKLVHFYDDVDEWELYDRMKDPNEMNNVILNPQYEDTLIKLKKELAELRKKYKVE